MSKKSRRNNIRSHSFSSDSQKILFRWMRSPRTSSTKSSISYYWWKFYSEKIILDCGDPTVRAKKFRIRIDWVTAWAWISKRTILGSQSGQAQHERIHLWSRLDMKDHLHNECYARSCREFDTCGSDYSVHRLYFHEVIVAMMGLLDWSSLFCLVTWWLLRSLPIMQCVWPVSERDVCCFMFFSFFLGRFWWWFLPSHASLALPVLQHQFYLLHHPTFRLLRLQLHWMLFLQPLPNFCFPDFSPLHNAAGLTNLSKAMWPPMLDTIPVSSWQSHMSIVHTPLFTSSLIVVASRVLRMCGFFLSGTTLFSTRTTFCIEMKGLTTLALLNDMHL